MENVRDWLDTALQLATSDNERNKRALLVAILYARIANMSCECSCIPIEATTDVEVLEVVRVDTDKACQTSILSESVVAHPDWIAVANTREVTDKSDVISVRDT